MKKILLLGGSFQQVIAIQTAKQLGYYTIVCDYLPDNPGQHIADKFYLVSTTDVEAIYEVARNEQVNGILAYASDPAAVPAAIVSERLGLPTNPAKSVEILGIKQQWRKFLSEHDFAHPKFYSFHTSTSIQEIFTNTADFTFPLVVKPTDSSGSKGVTILTDWQLLGDAIESAKLHSRNQILLIEEKISQEYPNVIGGDIFVYNGEIVLYGEMDCLRDKKSPLIPIGKKHPTKLNDIQKKNIHTELQRVISALDIKFGEMNIEILLDKNDNVHFLEIGPRAGGNMIPIQLSDIFGIDLVKANIQAAMGDIPDFLTKQLQVHDGCHMHYVLHSYTSGIFSGITIDPSISHNIYRKVIYKKYGDCVEKFDGAGKAVGIIFLHFNTSEDMEYFCTHHSQLIRIELQ